MFERNASKLDEDNMTVIHELKEREQLDLFRENLPHKPYHANQLEYGVRIADKSIAINSKHIQPNPPEHKYWLIYDLDRRGAGHDWRYLDVPEPNIVAENPVNGHAHLFYSINIPIRTAADGSTKALRFAAAVDNALRLKLDADCLYSGLIAKNPLHDYWRVHTYQDWCYDLSWLSEYLDLTNYTDKRKNLPDYGLGRNCNTFDAVRKWSYRAIRSHTGSYEQWLEKLLQRCLSYNQTHHSIPLEINEQRHIAKSIARWTWANMTPEGFSAYQASVGRKGGKKSKRKPVATSEASTKPWEKLGISRATYYRRKNKNETG